MIDYDSFLHCHLTKIFFAIHVVAKKLKVTNEYNLVQTDVLDVTFNFKSKKYWPFCKLNDQPLFIHVQSNNLPVIKKQLPFVLSNCLSQLSCNQEEFAKPIPKCEVAMNKNKYTRGPQYINILGSCKRKRK